MSHLNYDDSKTVIGQLSDHLNASRDVHWFNDHLGVARGDGNRIELFLPGGELNARLPVVAHLLNQGLWTRKGDALPFEAARLLLPAGEQYDAIAATVVVELAQSGLEHDRQTAFSRCEALIEVALLQADLAVESVIGLWGELFLLRLWLEASSPQFSSLDSWCGYRPSARDFSLGSLGVEVKTTLRSTSSHQVSGVHQTEPTPSDDRPTEEQLLLVSIGLEPIDQGLSVLDLIQQTDSAIRARDVARADDFQVHVSDYAARSTGYRRANENQPSILSKTYGVRFVRCYDMSDPDIQVLRLADLQARPHVQTDSVTFRINLPTQVRGDVNPTVGALSVIELLENFLGGLAVDVN